MTRSATPEETTQLEQLLDAIGMERLLTALSNICAEKQAHVEANWQDKALATAWGRMADRLDAFLTRIPGELA
ncbi:hypothetical protein [Mesorhizobium sp. B2-8-3]|uniref:hypothetical protein n=1 Tax=Mesorhizobium sp. B2-8-3 TaxID=2589905 RepID=UPI00112CFA10|nr:hypothetical protein [Mesorhizobium sp. B2-8-3]TPJ33693.1 hypothetical protein FJ418_13775 [Mesorhizobium sp. B2-8-3]